MTMVIRCPPKFVAEVASKLFRYTQFVSFVRQLNGYGFRKVYVPVWLLPVTYICIFATREQEPKDVLPQERGPGRGEGKVRASALPLLTHSAANQPSFSTHTF